MSICYGKLVVQQVISDVAKRDPNLPFRLEDLKKNESNKDIYQYSRLSRNEKHKRRNKGSTYYTDTEGK